MALKKANMIVDKDFKVGDADKRIMVRLLNTWHNWEDGVGPIEERKKGWNMHSELPS